jgi:curved DNA-binding protein CbpA
MVNMHCLSLLYFIFPLVATFMISVLLTAFSSRLRPRCASDRVQQVLSLSLVTLFYRNGNAHTYWSLPLAAYEILSDEEKRKQYDLTGDPSGQPKYQGGHPGGGFPGGPGGFQGGFHPGGQQQNAYYSFQGGNPGGQPNFQDFQGWGDLGQFFTQQQKTTRRNQEASQDSSWGGFGFPSFGNSNPGSGGFSGDMFYNLFGAAKKGFQDSFGGSKAGQDQVQFAKPVHQLDSSQFEEKLEEKERDMWLVFFYRDIGGGDLEEYVATLNRVAQDLMGVAKVRPENLKTRRDCILFTHCFHTVRSFLAAICTIGV